MKEKENFLTKRAQEVARQADFILEQTADWQIIKQYMASRAGDMQLTKKQEEKLGRYQFCYNEIMLGRNTDQQVANMAMKHFGISLSQAYDDIRCTKEVFTTIANLNKNFELNLALQLNTKYKAKAEEMGNMIAVAMFEKNRIDLIKQLPEEEDSLAENFQGHNYELTFDPKMLGGYEEVNMKEILDAINKKRGKEINIDMFEELESEDLEDEDE